MAVRTGPERPARPPDGSPPAVTDRRRVLLIIGALLLGMLLAALDQTIVATALPPIAGDLHRLSHLSWRWVFYINLPIGLAALVVTAVALPSQLSSARHKIDYAGTALIAAAATCLVLLTSLGGTIYPWASAEIIGLGVAAVILLAA